MKPTPSLSTSSSSSSPSLCPCGSELDLKSCCLPFIQGKAEPDTAEKLLRSRYTAFTLAEVDYILKTHHSKTKAEIKRDEIEEWAKGSEWLGLKIVQQEAGQPSDTEGRIIFCATYRAEGKTQEHWEQSFFERESQADGGAWRFLDARGVSTGPYRRAEPKIGRNDPCSCGSGKKFKKCCG